LLYAYASGVFDEGDIIYTRTLQPARYFLQIREWLGGDDDISFWFEQHQIERDIDGPILDKDFYKQMDGLVCISEKQKEAMVEAHPIDREKIYVHHDGVDLRSYENWTKTGAREDLGMELNEDIVMYTGHLYPEKDVETLVKAAKHFEEQCIIVGGYPDDISRIKSNITVPDNVTFTGFVPPSEIPLYQTAADVLVATVGANNDTDYFSPLKLFEYMAAGKPMVVSRKPEFEEILSHQESALMVKPESVSEMAEAINRCLDDANLGMQLGQRARERVDQYDWRVRAQNILTDIRTRRM
jgi:glycosyltransferase involved in cell wall biosynthesis